MDKGQKTFFMGLGAGFFVVCTIGFFVLLAMYLGGGSKNNGGAKVASGEEEEFPEKFSQCLDSGEFASVVRADMQLGNTLGVNGTPATLFNGYFLSGAMPFVAVEDIIKDLLAGETPFLDDFATYGLPSGELKLVGEPNLSDPVWKGNENAKVTVVEFSDFECPYCGRFRDTVDQMMSVYGDQIRFTYRHYPLSFHPQAQKSAEAFECAKAQGKAYEMHDKLFDLADNGELSVKNYKQAASELGLE